ncbi:hypothetical protein [Nonomuraea wenchangensis]|uniref:hypothetical protein n=1 Tax=Nonomuraea wenchangensis TaxID=568860 RepID=UPI0037A08F92
MTAVLETARVEAPASGEETASLLWSVIEPTFLTLMRWDPQVRVLTFPQDHPVLGWKVCEVRSCRQPAIYSQMCSGCERRWRRGNLPLQEFLAADKPLWSGIGESPCRVPECERPWKTSTQPICNAHLLQYKKLGLPLEVFLLHPDVVGYASFGPCQVSACDRDRDGHGPYCKVHTRTLVKLRRRQQVDEAHWRRTAPPVVEGGKVSLRGLSDQVAAEVIYGLQERTKAGARIRDFVLRPICDRARQDGLATLEDLDPAPLTKLARGLLTKTLRASALLRLTPEAERHKDVWDLAAFGHTGTLRFTGISQPWLRQAAKRWAQDDLPRRRSDKVGRIMSAFVAQIELLSQSLRLQRDDHGKHPAALDRQDITAFCNRLAYLVEQGTLTPYRRLHTCRNLRRILTRMRTLGLTHAGQPLHGLSDAFALGPNDIPDLPEDTEAGKDLPVEVMRVLCQNFDALEAQAGREVRVAVELLIDTGRRPDEIVQLPLDCLARDADGKPVLIYDNRKAARNARRLPITEQTAALVIGQQERARARFPRTAPADLKLLPTTVANREGRKAISANWVSSSNRDWADALPAISVPAQIEVQGRSTVAMVPFDKSKIFLYAYRHSYAQRHADAGVSVDVLCELMDHRQLTTTQCYYRVGEERRREAVDRVVTMQFDRHGNRIWRQVRTMLDSEHTRRAVGEVATPYGGCTEPSNVAAGGHACPFRFRCVGCGHFRTDVSYLPDLETYLADLLRSREKLLATVEVDDWARAEAMPSDEEISRVRRLISRIKDDVNDLAEEEKAQIMEAVTIVRRHRQGIVTLGMPTVRQPLPDVRPDRSA